MTEWIIKTITRFSTSVSKSTVYHKLYWELRSDNNTPSNPITFCIDFRNVKNTIIKKFVLTSVILLKITHE